MGKKNKQTNRRKKAQKPKKAPQKKNQRQPRKNDKSSLYRYWSYIWGVLGPALTLFALYYTFSPSITVTPGNELDIKNPFQIPFVIKNENIYSVSITDISFGIEKILTKNGALLINFSIALDQKMPIKILPKRQTTQFCVFDKMFRTAPIVSGIISAQIKYKTPWFYPNKFFNQTYRLYFGDNKTYWVPL